MPTPEQIARARAQAEAEAMMMMQQPQEQMSQGQMLQEQTQQAQPMPSMGGNLMAALNASFPGGASIAKGVYSGIKDAIPAYYEAGKEGLGTIKDSLMHPVTGQPVADIMLALGGKEVDRIKNQSGAQTAADVGSMASLLSPATAITIPPILRELANRSDTYRANQPQPSLDQGIENVVKGMTINALPMGGIKLAGATTKFVTSPEEITTLRQKALNISDADNVAGIEGSSSRPVGTSEMRAAVQNLEEQKFFDKAKGPKSALTIKEAFKNDLLKREILPLEQEADKIRGSKPIAVSFTNAQDYIDSAPSRFQPQLEELLDSVKQDVKVKGDTVGSLAKLKREEYKSTNYKGMPEVERRQNELLKRINTDLKTTLEDTIEKTLPVKGSDQAYATANEKYGALSQVNKPINRGAAKLGNTDIVTTIGKAIAPLGKAAGAGGLAFLLGGGPIGAGSAAALTTILSTSSGRLALARALEGSRVGAQAIRPALEAATSPQVISASQLIPKNQFPSKSNKMVQALRTR